MPSDRVGKLVDAYFNQPFEEYGELVLEIMETGGLTQDEIGIIKSRVLCVDAETIIRHAGNRADFVVAQGAPGKA